MVVPTPGRKSRLQYIPHMQQAILEIAHYDVKQFCAYLSKQYSIINPANIINKSEQQITNS